MQIRTTLSTMLLSGICFIGLPLSAAPTTKGQTIMDKTGQVAKISVVDVSSLLAQDPQALKEEGTISHEWRDLYSKHLEAMKEVDEKLTKLQSDYQTKIKELEALQKSGISSQEMLQKRYNEEVAPLAYQLQTQPQQAQQFHMNEIRKFQSIVGQKIQKATDDVCKAQGWDFAISKDIIASHLGHGSPFDITQKVASIINEAYSKDKAKVPSKGTKAA